MRDAIATRLWEALLLFMRLLSLVAWWLSPREPLLPSSPTSVGAVLALLQAGDVLEYLYPPGQPGPILWKMPWRGSTSTGDSAWAGGLRLRVLMRLDNVTVSGS